MRKLAALLASAAIFAATAAHADPFAVMGARALGMGGAYTAIAQGAVGQYWNPAGLAQAENTSGLQIPVGVSAALTGTVVHGANEINNVAQGCNSGNPSICNSANINQALSDFNQPGNGALIGADGGAMLKLGALTFGLINVTSIGATPDADLTNTTPGTFSNNQSKIILQGGSFTEGVVSYAHSFFVPGLTVGGSAKLIKGQIGYEQFAVAQKSFGATGSLSDYKNNTQSTTKFAFDLGAMWDVSKAVPVLPFHPTAGLVMRDINQPKFDEPAVAIAAGDPTQYELARQTRFGAAIHPFHWWNVSADIDLTKNQTEVGNYQSRMFGLGTEINVFNRSWINIPLRVGWMKNLAESAESPAVTAGVGLNFLHFMVDVGGAISTSTVQTKNNSTFPSSAGVAAQLGFMF